MSCAPGWRCCSRYRLTGRGPMARAGAVSSKSGTGAPHPVLERTAAQRISVEHARRPPDSVAGPRGRVHQWVPAGCAMNRGTAPRCAVRCARRTGDTGRHRRCVRWPVTTSTLLGRRDHPLTDRHPRRAVEAASANTFGTARCDPTWIAVGASSGPTSRVQEQHQQAARPRDRRFSRGPSALIERRLDMPAGLARQVGARESAGKVPIRAGAASLRGRPEHQNAR